MFRDVAFASHSRHRATPVDERTRERFANSTRTHGARDVCGARAERDRDRAQKRVERARRDESADERGTRGGATSSGVSGRRRARERGG